MLSAEGLFAVNDEGHGLVSVVVHPDLAFAGKVVKFIGSLLYMRVAAAIEVPRQQLSIGDLGVGKRLGGSQRTDDATGQ